MLRTRFFGWICAFFAAVLMLPSTTHAQHTQWYLGEGATGPFFEMDILIGNPNPSDTHVNITYLKPDGSTVPQAILMGATSRLTIRVNDIPGLESTAVSAVVQASQNIVVDRTMYWAGGQRYGGHNSRAVAAPATAWYLAEGSTGLFQTYILFANPNGTPANVTLTFLKEDGTTHEVPWIVPANGRETVLANWYPELANTGFATIVTSDLPIVVERAMYWGSTWQGGHGSPGVTAPSQVWAFGEGFTGSAGPLGFDTYLLLANTGTIPANVTVTYFREAHTPVVRPYTVPARSRFNVWVNDDPDLNGRSFSMLVVSDQPILAERSIYWGPTEPRVWVDGHNTPGLAASSADPGVLPSQYAFAEGIQDGNYGTFFDSVFLLVNPHATSLALTATYYREDGKGITVPLTVDPVSRFTLFPSSYPELSNQKFATIIQSGDGRGFVVERAVYWSGFQGGHSSTGTPWSGAVATPEPPPPAAASAIAPNVGVTSGGTDVVITGTNFSKNASVSIGGVAAQNVRVVNSTTIVANTGGRQAGAADVVVTSNNQVSTLVGAYTYAEPGPPPPPPPPPNRTPDPPPGGQLPLPNMFHIVEQVANQFPGALRNSCQSHGGTWEFMDRLVDRLREIDTRWAYNWKRGNVGDPSEDVIAYHWGSGPDEGSINVYLVDVIFSHCGPEFGFGPPVPAWQDVTGITFGGGSIGRWTGRGRF